MLNSIIRFALRQRILKYEESEAVVDHTKRLELMMKQRLMLDEDIANVSGSQAEVATVPDYEMDRYGIQHGETIDGND